MINRLGRTTENRKGNSVFKYGVRGVTQCLNVTIYQAIIILDSVFMITYVGSTFAGQLWGFTEGHVAGASYDVIQLTRALCSASSALYLVLYN